MEHMEVYGEKNEERMSGEHETSKYDEFSFDKERSVDRGASVRVGYETIKNGKGYLKIDVSINYGSLFGNNKDV